MGKDGETLEILDEESSVRIYVDPKSKDVSVFLGREDRKSSGIEWLRAQLIAAEIAKHDEELALVIEERLNELRDASCVYILLDKMKTYGREVVERERKLSGFDILEGCERKSIPLASRQAFHFLYLPLYFLNEKYSSFFYVLEKKGFHVGFDEKSVRIKKDDVEVRVLDLGDSSLIQSNNPPKAREMLEDLQEIVFEEMLEVPAINCLNEFSTGLELVSYNLEKGKYTVKMPELALPVRVCGENYLVRIEEYDKKRFAEELSIQIKFVYGKSREIGDKKLFEEFLKQLEALYPEIFPLALDMIKQDSEDVKKFLDNYGKIDIKKMLIAAGIAGILGAAVYFLVQDRQPPSIKIIKESRQNGNLYLEAEIKDPSGVSGAYALIKYPSGRSLNVTLSASDSIYSSPPIKLSEEGNYSIQIFAADSKGNSGSISTTLDYWDNPKIGNLTHFYVPEKLSMNVSAFDTSGISNVIFEVMGKNYTASPLNVDALGNGVYGIRITLPIQKISDEINYRVFAFDKFNRVSVMSGNISLTPKQVFLSWVKDRGYDVALASKLFDEVNLIQDLFHEGKLNILENVLKVACWNGSDLPKNLAYVVLDQIIRDYRVDSKTEAVDKIFNTYVEFGLEDLSIDQIYHTNNASLIMGADRSILDALKAIKKYGVKLGEIAKDVVEKVANVHANLARLFKYNVTIRDEDVQVIAGRYSKFYPEFKNWKNLMGLILRKAAEQIQRLLYDTFEGGKKDKLAKPETK